MERGSKNTVMARLSAATAHDREPLPEPVLLSLLILGAVVGLLVGPNYKTLGELGEAIERQSMSLAIGLAVVVAVLAWGDELGGRPGGWVRLLARGVTLTASWAAVFLLVAFAWLRDEHGVIANDSPWPWFWTCAVIGVLSALIFLSVRWVGRKAFGRTSEASVGEGSTDPSAVSDVVPGTAVTSKQGVGPSPGDSAEPGGCGAPQPHHGGSSWLAWTAVGASAFAVLVGLEASRRARR